MEEKSGNAGIYTNADFLKNSFRWLYDLTFRNSYVIVFPFPM